MPGPKPGHGTSPLPRHTYRGWRESSKEEHAAHGLPTSGDQGCPGQPTVRRPRADHPDPGAPGPRGRGQVHGGQGRAGQAHQVPGHRAARARGAGQDQGRHHHCLSRPAPRCSSASTASRPSWPRPRRTTPPCCVCSTRASSPGRPPSGCAATGCWSPVRSSPPRTWSSRPRRAALLRSRPSWPPSRSPRRRCRPGRCANPFLAPDLDPGRTSDDYTSGQLARWDLMDPLYRAFEQGAGGGAASMDLPPVPRIDRFSPPGLQLMPHQSSFLESGPRGPPHLPARRRARPGQDRAVGHRRLDRRRLPDAGRRTQRREDQLGPRGRAVDAAATRHRHPR